MPIQIAVFFAIDVTLLVLYSLDAALAEPLGAFFSYLVDLNSERNLPSWYSSVKLFLVGYLILLHAYSLVEVNRNGAYMMLLLAPMLLFMSIDETVGIHERIGVASDVFLPGQDRANSVFPATGIWMFVLLLPAFVLILSILRRLRSRVMPVHAYRVFVSGLVIFVVSAGGIEMLSNFANDGALSFLQIASEEFGEMIGATLMLWAAYIWVGNPFCTPTGS